MYSTTGIITALIFIGLYLGLEFIGFWIYRSGRWQNAFRYFLCVPFLSSFLWTFTLPSDTIDLVIAQGVNAAFLMVNLILLSVAIAARKKYGQAYMAYLDEKIAGMRPAPNELRKAGKSLGYNVSDPDFEAQLTDLDREMLLDQWREDMRKAFDDPFECRRLFSSLCRDDDEAPEAVRKRRIIIAAVTAVLVITAVICAIEIPKSVQYHQAIALMNDGQFEAALPIFESLDRHGYSKAYAYYCTARIYAAQGQYTYSNIYLTHLRYGKRSAPLAAMPEGYIEFCEDIDRRMDEASKKSEQEAERRYQQRVVTSDTPFENMYESDVGKTKLGKPNGTPWHNYDIVRGQRVEATIYEWIRDGYVVFSARCQYGRVQQVWDDRAKPWKRVKTASTSTRKTPAPSSKPKRDDPLEAWTYDNPEDFYDDNYYDFFDYEEAEDYYYEHVDD